MRQFIVLSHSAPPSDAFSLDDLPGAGRLDVLCRCVTAAFLLSHDIREDVRCQLVLGDELTIRFEGHALRNLRPDERSTAALIRSTLAARGGAVGNQPVETHPGISLVRRGVEAVLSEAAESGTLVQLHEEGDPIVGLKPPTDPVFVLSDHREFSQAEAAVLADRAVERVRIGPERIHADHTITVVHNYLDTEGYDRY